MDTSSNDSSSDAESKTDSDDSSESVEDDRVFKIFYEEVKSEFSALAASMTEELMQEGVEEDEVVTRVDLHFYPHYKRAFRRKVRDHILRNEFIKRHSVYQKLIKQAYKLHREEDYDMDDAVKATMNIRKHLVDRVFESLDNNVNNEKGSLFEENCDDRETNGGASDESSEDENVLQ